MYLVNITSLKQRYDNTVIKNVYKKNSNHLIKLNCKMNKTCKNIF